MTTEESVDGKNESLGRSEWWAATFWSVLGICLVGLVLLVAGFQIELLLPGIALVGYGLFVHWNPRLAQSSGPWTGVLWILIGLGTLIAIRFVQLDWSYEITGILVGLFLIFIGFLGLFDL